MVPGDGIVSFSHVEASQVIDSSLRQIIEKRQKRGSGVRARYTIVDDLGEGRANPCVAPAAGIFVYIKSLACGVHHRDRGGAHISRSPEVLERRRFLEGATV